MVYGIHTIWLCRLVLVMFCVFMQILYTENIYAGENRKHRLDLAGSKLDMRGVFAPSSSEMVKLSWSVRLPIP